MRWILGLSLVWILFAAQASRAATDPFLDLADQGETLLMTHRFAALDAMADELRRTDARFVGGHAKLWHLYGDLSDFKGSNCGCMPDQESISLEDKRAAIRAWLVQRPHSIAAPIVMAQLLTREAWVARTGETADNVSEAQWALYRKKLRAADGYLEKLDPSSDPVIYEDLMETADGDGDTRSRLDTLYAAAVKAFPTFFHYYSARADNLQTKWYGEEGELAAYTQSLLAEPGGDNGEIAYSYVAGHLAILNARSPGLLFEGTGLSWPEIRSAYAVRERRYGLNVSDWSALLFFALAAGDFRAGREFVGHIGKDFSPTFWPDAGAYAVVVKWAQAH